MPTRAGSFHLFRIFGIDVYVHYAWFLAVAYFVSQERGYSSLIWNVGECLSMFLIVLIHEFGHAFACRSVGGQANQITLWLFGGVAFVSPPQRPGAQLWSIAAGPLVNVVLLPILTGIWIVAGRAGWDETAPETYRLLYHVQAINILLLIFNMMPVYPLDGGQILRSLLWFMFGRAKSLLIATIIGFIGVAGLIFGAVTLFLKAQDAQSQRNAVWLGLMAVFILMNCWGGLRHALALARVAKLPRREGFACPTCKTAPPLGALWRCGKCGQPFDTFLSNATCPHCGTQYNATQCLDCGSSSPIGAWITSSAEPGMRS
jgi:Zn-dependent protease